MTRCRKHRTEWLFPTRDMVDAAHHADFAVMLLTAPVRRVICAECGAVGHKIKSMRGGIVWDADVVRSTYINNAIKWWGILGLTAPEFITKHTQQP